MLADTDGRPALVLVGASHMDLLGHGNGDDQMPGARIGTGHARRALIRIHHGGAIRPNGHGAELACADAGTEAQAAERALQGAARHLVAEMQSFTPT